MSDDTEFAYFAGRREGAAAERERIIKLLEEQVAICKENNYDENGQRADWETYWDVRIQEFEVAIALIKGESQVDSKPTETETPCQCKKQP